MGKPSDLDIKDLFEQYYPRLCEFAYRMLSCRETARDLVQDVFVTLLENNQLAGVSTQAINGYLYGMVKHAALNTLRRRNIADRIFGNQSLNPVEEADVLQHIMHAEILAELYTALESLPKGCSQVCRMAYLEGKKNQEIADSLGVSINTIKTQKQRAMHLLKNRLTPQALGILMITLFR